MTQENYDKEQEQKKKSVGTSHIVLTPDSEKILGDGYPSKPWDQRFRFKDVEVFGELPSSLPLEARVHFKSSDDYKQKKESLAEQHLSSRFLPYGMEFVFPDEIVTFPASISSSVSNTPLDSEGIVDLDVVRQIPIEYICGYKFVSQATDAKKLLHNFAFRTNSSDGEMMYEECEKGFRLSFGKHTRRVYSSLPDGQAQVREHKIFDKPQKINDAINDVEKTAYQHKVSLRSLKLVCGLDPSKFVIVHKDNHPLSYCL